MRLCTIMKASPPTPHPPSPTVAVPHLPYFRPTSNTIPARPPRSPRHWLCSTILWSCRPPCVLQRSAFWPWLVVQASTAIPGSVGIKRTPHRRSSSSSGPSMVRCLPVATGTVGVLRGSVAASSKPACKVRAEDAEVAATAAAAGGG